MFWQYKHFQNIFCYPSKLGGSNRKRDLKPLLNLYITFIQWTFKLKRNERNFNTKNSKVIGIFLTLRWKFELNSNEYGESNYKLDTHVKNNLPIFTSPPRHGQFDTKTKIDPTQGCKWDTMS
jgi:hypothetical protein